MIEGAFPVFGWTNSKITKTLTIMSRAKFEPSTTRMQVRSVAVLMNSIDAGSIVK
jgi:hypothetical protein